MWSDLTQLWRQIIFSFHSPWAHLSARPEWVGQTGISVFFGKRRGRAWHGEERGKKNIQLTNTNAETTAGLKHLTLTKRQTVTCGRTEVQQRSEIIKPLFKHHLTFPDAGGINSPQFKQPWQPFKVALTCYWQWQCVLSDIWDSCHKCALNKCQPLGTALFCLVNILMTVRRGEALSSLSSSGRETADLASYRGCRS